MQYFEESEQENEWTREDHIEEAGRLLQSIRKGKWIEYDVKEIAGKIWGHVHAAREAGYEGGVPGGHKKLLSDEELEHIIADVRAEAQRRDIKDKYRRRKDTDKSLRKLIGKRQITSFDAQEWQEGIQNSYDQDGNNPASGYFGEKAGPEAEEAMKMAHQMHEAVRRAYERESSDFRIEEIIKNLKKMRKECHKKNKVKYDFSDFNFDDCIEKIYHYLKSLNLDTSRLQEETSDDKMLQAIQEGKIADLADNLGRVMIDEIKRQTEAIQQLPLDKREKLISGLENIIGGKSRGLFGR